LNSYDQILGTFKRIVPLPSILHEEDAYHLSPAKLEQQINDLGLTALMLSNPHNPTGQVIHGEELKRLVDISREKGTTLILDEVSSLF
jgi:aspartate/methionine/tyrosine aminotransferase